MNGNSRQYLAELIGTFVLVFIGAGTGALAGITGGGLVAVALAHGFAVTTMIYAFGSISGAHINPAVTFGIALAGKMDWGKAVGYWIAQFAGGALAGYLLLAMLVDLPPILKTDMPPRNLPKQASIERVPGDLGQTLGVLSREDLSSYSPAKTIAVEAVLTFFLVAAVFGSGVAGRNGNAVGIAIGLVVAMDILVGGYLTGASLNPARSFGPALAMQNLAPMWMYLVGPLAGGGAAALVYKALFLEQKK
jgi:MIP family channel proteins